MRITKKWLEEADACRSEVERFEEVFGESAEVNEENIRKAVELYMNFEWVIDELADAYYQLTNTPLELYNVEYKKTARESWWMAAQEGNNLSEVEELWHKIMLPYLIEFFPRLVKELEDAEAIPAGLRS